MLLPAANNAIAICISYGLPFFRQIEAKESAYALKASVH